VENFTAQNRSHERLGRQNDGRAFSIFGTQARLLISSMNSFPEIRCQNKKASLCLRSLNACVLLLGAT
jgi:hypothetical protein